MYKNKFLKHATECIDFLKINIDGIPWKAPLVFIPPFKLVNIWQTNKQIQKNLKIISLFNFELLNFVN